MTPAAPCLPANSASPESTRIYTRVSDPAVVADYNRALGSQDTNDDEQF